MVKRVPKLSLAELGCVCAFPADLSLSHSHAIAEIGALLFFSLSLTLREACNVLHQVVLL